MILFRRLLADTTTFVPFFFAADDDDEDEDDRAREVDAIRWWMVVRPSSLTDSGDSGDDRP